MSSMITARRIAASWPAAASQAAVTRMAVSMASVMCSRSPLPGWRLRLSLSGDPRSNVQRRDI
jgi:hypothetical protein